MADIGHAADGAFDPHRRPVGIRRRRPGRPLRPGSAPVTIDHPTPQVPAASRRRTIGIEKTLAVEMIGNRALVIARHPCGLYCAPAPAAGHNATVDVAGLCTYFPAALARDLTLVTADRPARPEATARQRDAPSGGFVFFPSPPGWGGGRAGGA